MSEAGTQVGAQIRRLRKAKRWTVAQLAVYADMSPSAVSQIETGRRSPTAASMSKLAEALEVEVRDFFPLEQAPLPLDDPVDGAGDPAEAARTIGALADTAAELATAWNRDVEFHEQHGRSLLPSRTLEMSCTVVVLYQRFWGALATLQHDAESLSLDPNPATWQPELKDFLLEAGSSIQALAELHAIIKKAAGDPGGDREDSRALREEFDVIGTPAFLAEDPHWGEAIDKARAAAGIA